MKPAFPRVLSLVSLAALPLASCTRTATNNPPSDEVREMVSQVPADLTRFPFGIPDWVRVISADPLEVDRKSFGPGDIVPIVVVPKNPSQGELYSVSFSTNSPLIQAGDLFETVPSYYVTDSAEGVRAFSLHLRVKPAAQLPNNPVTVTTTIVGVEQGSPRQAVSNPFVVSR